VSEISTTLKNYVEDSFSFVRVKGEISGLKIHTSGHVYFSLKDENSLIDGICWKGVASALSLKLQDGLEVVCSGRITTYPARSKY
jgi:exodeoxyribonuclease VII large subunit